MTVKTYFPEGAPCWADVMVPDPDAARAFYSELMGWMFEEPDPNVGGYTSASRDDKAVAAVMPQPEPAPTAWGVYLSVPDIEATVERVRAGGGQIMTEPMPIADIGTMAVIADPGGAVIGLWQAGEFPGFELQGRPGSFSWAEVYTHEKEKVDRFYADVFHLEGKDSDDPTYDFRVWAPSGQPVDDEHAVLGRCRIADPLPADMPAHVRIYFSVEDCDATVRTAQRLGGRLLEDPQDSPYGRHAVLADNQGAAFAVLGPAPAS
ncbi:VOC family protein [Streptomyces sodiiphilus]|uniref:VOC family protein n=1 Tax=Streptomyces sodiiphilus TaxID=226217 RepID=A0ABN2NUQ7_9ACTN